MGQKLAGRSGPQRRIALIVEDDAELRWLTATLLEESELDIIECESAEAALATMLIRGKDVTMIFADIRLPGVMDGVDLAREVKMRWPHLTVVVTSGNPGERLEHLPTGVIYMPNAYLHIWNGGSTQNIYGALSAANIYFNHSANLHYDTSLRTAVISGVDAPYQIMEWRELTDPTEKITLP